MFFGIPRTLLPATLLVIAMLILHTPKVFAQKPPYFVTYSHLLEEPGNLEIAQKSTGATPKNANGFYSSTLELEYGATAHWTTEVYLQGQTTANDSTIFTGFRWENRVRPFLRDFFLNPVLYVEYEDVNLADKSVLEVTGNDGLPDFQISNAQGRAQVSRSLENRLILSSNFHGWNLAENFIAEKNLLKNPWEFGYALGVSRPLALAANGHPCRFCRQNFSVGAEMFGGLGTSHVFGLPQTSQYAGPTIALNIPRGPMFSFSPEFGLNAYSVGTLWRLNTACEIQQLCGLLHRKTAQ